jgi:hypothetical protein
MLVFSRFVRIFSIAISAIFLFPIGVKMKSSQVSQRAETSSAAQRIKVTTWTDRGKYSLGDTVRIYVSLQNTGSEEVYIDRRMFWTGLSGGLKLEIDDENGAGLPARLLSDAMMPPPNIEDTSILIPLDEGFFYGTFVNLSVKGFFPKPGKYFISVVYKSMLSKESVAPQLRGLPALWHENTPSIAADPIRIDVTQ